MLLQWDLAKGILEGVDPQGAGVRGTGLTSFAFIGPLLVGPCSTGREAGPSEGWIHRSTTLGVCAVEAILVMETGSLWDFDWGMGEGDAAGLQTDLCLLGLNTSPSRCPLALPLSEQSY